MKHAGTVLFTLLFLLGSPGAAVGQTTLIAELHAAPPPPCKSKLVGDMSSGIAILPDGTTREQVRGVMGFIASKVLSRGANQMTPDALEAVYTVVFFEDQPINEIGIYAYEFSKPIGADMFQASPELNGELFVVDHELLLILWHEDYTKTARCVGALKKILSKEISSDD